MQSGRDNGDWRAREKGYQMIRTAVDTWLSNHTKKVLVTDPRTAKRHAHAWLPLYGVKAFAGEEGVDYAMHGPGQHYYGAGRMMRGIAIAAEKYPGLE